MMIPDLDSLMEFAVQTVAGAGRITESHFGSAVVAFKGDGSEVTLADTESEEYIRAAIAERFPGHDILGEEGVRVESGGRFRWIVDPIDGTRSFASGVPLYGVLLTFEVDAVPLLGCCHFPTIGDTLVAATKAGCWRGGQRVRVSDCDRIEDARVVTSGLEYWRDWATPAGRAGFDSLVDRCRFARTWGDCFGYVMIATGRAEIMADPACGAHWDFAPMIPIIAESGGEYTTLGNQRVSAWSSALATNRLLHASAVECWGSASDDEIQVTEIRDRAKI
jgi:histidinol phosphatase-like enzyme (inositol monophosphatase family)